MAFIYYKTESEIRKIRESSLIVSNTLTEVAKAIKPGVSGAQLDKLAEDFIESAGAKPAFKGYRGFPGTLCISVNAQVVHGIPGNYILKEGDIVSVDCGVVKDGFYGDSAYTFAVGVISPDIEHLLKITKESLYKGIEAACGGNRIGDIGEAIQKFVESHNYGVVRELVGHGIGRSLHEAPDVPNYGRRGNGQKLKAGMVICIEPMINMGTKNVKQEADGWTMTTADGKPSAHFEHTIAITDGKALILTSFEKIEEVERKTVEVK